MSEIFQRRRMLVTAIPDTVRFKWTDALMTEGFVAFPKPLIRALPSIFHGELGMAHLALVLAIIDYKRPNATRQPSVEFLAFTSGLSVDLVRKCLEDLRAAGLARYEGAS